MAKKRKVSTKKFVRQTEDKPYVPNVKVEPDVDDGPFGGDGLSVRMRAFVDAITGPAAGNATKAAEMAGYASENRNALFVTACRVLSNAKVQEAISHAFAKRNMTPEWAKNRLMDMVQADMRNFLSLGDDGQPKLDFVKAGAAGALGQVREYKEEGFSTGSGEPVIVKRTIKLHDPTSAINTLLRLLNLINDRDAGTAPTGDLPVERHPAALSVKAPPGTDPLDDQSGPIQDRPGGPPVGEDGAGKTEIGPGAI